MENKYQIGTTKVSWFDENDKHLLKSQMFAVGEEKSAKEFSDTKKDALSMVLVNEVGDRYEWRLVTDKNTWKMDVGVAMFNNKLVLLIFAILLIMGIVYSFKLITNN